MVFREALDRVKRKGRITLQIFATDLDADAIGIARRGFYPANIVADVSPERLARFFVEEEGGYRIGKEIREMVVFAPQNIIMDPPFTKLEILCCRNLLIYLDADLQKMLLPLFHYCLNPGGVLFLGSAEAVGKASHLFVELEGRFKIYRRGERAMRAMEVTFPSRTHMMQGIMPEIETPPTGTASLQELADRLLLQQIAPAAVLVNAEGDILYVNGRTGKYLEPAAGRANWNIYAMAREGLRQELALMLPRALRAMETISQSDVQIKGDVDVSRVKLTVHPISQPEALRGMVLIAFVDMPAQDHAADGKRPSRGRRASMTELERALQSAREEIKKNREEMQTQQEELKSSNEELQSTNEELQSTNEELTTSKEELQSLNEELQTVNAELQSKLDDLSSVNSDMKNLLNSTDIATVFLSSSLHVRRFTTQATKIFKLIPGDVGRPLSDIATDLDYPQLTEDAQQVLGTLIFSEKEVATHDGRWFKVRIMPYRTLENVIDGVVITFSDITAAKTLEAELRKALIQKGSDGES
jgi:two-component system CheB/CheR fusion protein